MEDVSFVRARGVATVAGQQRPDLLHLDSFHMRKEPPEPTEFGYFLMRAMADQDPPLTQAELARQASIGQATISRWIFNPGRPDAEKLRSVAEPLGVEYDVLMAAAGYGQSAENISEVLSNLRQEVDPLAGELSSMLSPDSPLSEEDRAFLRHTVDRLVDPYRRAMRRRRSA